MTMYSILTVSIISNPARAGVLEFALWVTPIWAGVCTLGHPNSGRTLSVLARNPIGPDFVGFGQKPERAELNLFELSLKAFYH